MERQRICIREKEACEMLGISRSTLFKSGIPFSYINACKVYRIKDIEEYLDAHMVQPAEQNGGTES